MCENKKELVTLANGIIYLSFFLNNIIAYIVATFALIIWMIPLLKIAYDKLKSKSKIFYLYSFTIAINGYLICKSVIEIFSVLKKTIT